MKTIFINHLERMSVSKKNKSRIVGVGKMMSAMSSTVKTCYYCKKTGHKVGDCKIKLENKFEVKKPEKNNNERKKTWCSYHNSSGLE